MEFFCSRCGDRVYIFQQTKKGKIYCWKCWNEVMKWLLENKKKTPNGCFFCGNENIVWSDKLWISWKKLQLCQDCYDIYVLNKISVEVQS